MADMVEKVVSQRPDALVDTATHYCPGCLHGVIHRVVAEAIDELDIRERTIGVAPVGCSVLAYHYFDVDFAEAAHGRAPAMATGLKRVQPDRVVFTYQGDGDLAAIGTNELIHAAARGEQITTIFVNNAIYGMTGGQMAPTTLPGQITSSTPFGRDTAHAGYPIRVCEMVATLSGPAYVVRRSAVNPKDIRQLKRAIVTAFKVQMAGLGYSLVEVISNCPTNWGMTPLESLNWVEANLLPYYPPGDYKVLEAVKAL
jgi:2-oxoglutarate/2-oxoacid ferredoxin oxidoreductase subunit beta